MVNPYILLLASASKLLGASNQVAALAVGAAALLMIAVALSLSARRKAAQKQLVGAGAASESA